MIAGSQGYAEEADGLVDEWVDDSLPHLMMTMRRGRTFDVVTMTAVWMHLDELERRHAMPNVASLLRPGGLLIMSLRHGPSPLQRRMFDVSPEETIALAETHRFRSLLTVRSQSAQLVNRKAGITWSHLAFECVRRVSSSVDAARGSPSPDSEVRRRRELQ